MAEQFLHGADVGPLLQEMGRERVPQCMGTGRLGKARLLHRPLHRLLHGGGGAVVPLDVAAPRILGPPLRRKDVLPSPLCRCIRILPPQSLRHRGRPVPGLQVFLPDGVAFLKLPPERVLKHSGEHRPPIFLALALPHRDLLILEVQVLHPEPKRLREAKARPVKQVGHEPVRAVHLLEHRRDFFSGEDHRKPVRLPGPVEVGYFVPVGAEHIAMEKQKGVQGLVLRRGRHGSLRGEV